MAKAKEKQTPVPRRKAKPEPVGESPSSADPSAPPDLSHITPGLRPLARPIGELQFHPKNPRKHSEKNLASIRASLRQNGQLFSLLASDRTGMLVVIAGNGRLAAALAEGWTHLAVEVRSDFSQAKENQIAIADNRSAEEADWDGANLAEMLRDLDTGNDPDLDRMMCELAEAEKLIPADGDDSPGEEEEPPAKFEIIIECEGEEQQRELFERLTGEGLKCRVLSL